MSELPLNSPALPPESGSWPAGPKPGEGWLPGPKPPDEGWTRRRFALVLLFVLALHVSLIFLFGAKKQIVPRPAKNVPQLQLADEANEIIALGDPTLFARPNAHDLVTAFWRQMPAIAQPKFDWTGAPRFLSPAPGNLGALFRDMVRNTRAPDFPLDLKPEPKIFLPEVALADAAPRTTTWQISGDLAGRGLLRTNELPSLPRNDVLAPSTVQALVDTAGNVASAVVLRNQNVDHEADHEADQIALQLVRNLRFAPAPRLMFGEVTFIWHTVPTNAVRLTNTNANP
jgi:hypothetical protein